MKRNQIFHDFPVKLPVEDTLKTANHEVAGLLENSDLKHFVYV